MKTLKMPADAHSKLTMSLSELTALTSKIQDAVKALLKESVILPLELLAQMQSFIEENKQLGFTTKEQFASDAVRFRLNWLKSDSQCLEVPREDYEKLNEALKEMDTPFQDAEHFVNSQIREFLEKYEEHKNDRK